MGCAVFCCGSDRVATFSALPAGDQLVIRSHYSTGFSPVSTYEFQFNPADGGSFDVDAVQVEWAEAGKTEVVKTRKRLGRVPLEKGALDRLDALLTHYRSTPLPEVTLDHTAREGVQVRQIREGVTIAEERFTDYDPKTTRGRKDLLSFDQILKVLFPDEQPQAVQVKISPAIPPKTPAPRKP
ncbi:MAG TPA: hypothetical protein VHO24_10925 [Opitutaceae bacterium]|nr:hypothetical protein [Opitutaceae bacterium]